MEARGLGFAFDETPLFTGLDLAVQSGDSVAIVGPNGSGKTTLLRLIVGELNPTQGELWVTETAQSWTPNLGCWTSCGLPRP